MSLNTNLGNLVTYTKLIDVSDASGNNAIDDLFIVDPSRGPFLVSDVAFCLVSFTSVATITGQIGVRTIGTNNTDSSILSSWSFPGVGWNWNAVNQWILPAASTNGAGASVKYPVSIAAGSTVSFKNTAASNGTLVRISVVVQGYYLNP